jgi:DNA-binding protein H-NS
MLSPRQAQRAIRRHLPPSTERQGRMPHKEIAQEGAELTSVNTLKRNFSSARRRLRTEAKARNRVPAGPAAVCSRNQQKAGQTWDGREELSSSIKTDLSQRWV